jgi:manganese transport protein
MDAHRREFDKPLPDRAAARAMREALQGRRHGLAALLPFAGPAVVVSVAYVDPGNFASNIEAGSRYGYALLWVVVLANLVAMLFQALSARLGIVTGRNLAELCREHLPTWAALSMWGVSEIAAMATDLAEFLGGALGVSLLLGVSLPAGMVAVAVVTYVLLLLERGRYRRLELAIGSLVGIVGLAYLAELAIAPMDWGAAVRGLAPRLPDGRAVAIAMAILGATVMPHALFLHSDLSSRRLGRVSAAQRRRLLRYSNVEVVAALSMAGLINLGMVMVAAASFHAGHPGVARIETAYRTLAPLLGGGAAAIFLVSLIASGVSSSVVGTMAGQMIMQGFVGFHVPLWLRRLVTMAPSFAVVALGVDPTRALVVSQVVLSLALPVPMLALLGFTSRARIMGRYRNGPLLLVLAALCAALVLALNALLVLQALGLDWPR